MTKRRWSKVNLFFFALLAILLGVTCIAAGMADRMLGLIDWILG